MVCLPAVELYGFRDKLGNWAEIKLGEHSIRFEWPLEERYFLTSKPDCVYRGRKRLEYGLHRFTKTSGCLEHPLLAE